MEDLFKKMDTITESMQHSVSGLEERIDGRINELEERINVRINELEGRIDGRVSGLEARVNGRIDELEERVKKAPQLVLEIRDEEEAACKRYANQLHNRLMNYSFSEAMKECYIEGEQFKTIDWDSKNGYGPGTITTHDKFSHHAIVWYTKEESTVTRQAMYQALIDRRSDKMPLLRIMMQGLSECPKVHNRVVFRGVRVFETAAFARRYMQGRVVVEVLPQSTSAQPTRALRFADAPDSAMFVMFIDWGYNLQLWSCYRDEQEIMLPPGTYWRVVENLDQSPRIVVLQQVNGEPDAWCLEV
eukprot:TRINITY_DN68005_c0_g2_i1.p1 TRINITY_DN68005_c0_g2~~TRINITY_DN68005_c0_g2_i1.p1  ORF type:complete len:319 (+),score=43.44 TRINITY_DN68005_c0_g2_i1:52-957(+)